MNDRWPPEIEELLAVYALDAVDEAERALVDDYLRDNPRAVAEVESYREALSYLHAGAPAPAGLWDRIASELESSPPPLRLDAFRPPSRRRPRGRVFAIAAAAVAIAAVGGILVQQQLEDDRRDSEPVAAAVEREASDAQRDSRSRTVLMRNEGGTLSVAAYAETDGDLFVMAAPLPPLGDSRTYQLWCVRDDSPSPVSLAVLGARPATTKLHLDSCAGQFAITDERSGGAAEPSGDPVVAGRYV
jgi:anti-sigma-K factor RskA